MNERYSRQILFQGIGNVGQEKIGKAHVLIMGAGALGSSIAEMLVRAGVAKISIIDRDYVEASNLQRQQLYKESDAINKLPKVVAAKNRLNEINSDVTVETYLMDATAETLEPLMGDIDLVMDATDNFETRMILNDLSQKHHIPWIYGGCVGSVGMSFTVIPGETPCLSCLLKTIPMQGMTCDNSGIISPAVQITVSHQVAEAMKILVGATENLRSAYTYFDIWNNQYHSIKTTNIKDESCLSCGSEPTYPFLSEENSTKTSVLCGRDTVQIRPRADFVGIDFETLKAAVAAVGYEVMINPFLLSAEKNGQRIVFFKDGRALVHGTKDIAEAKSIYQKIMG